MKALPKKSISVVRSFVICSCDFVDRPFCPQKQRTIHEVTQTNTNQNDFRFDLDMIFEAKLLDDIKGIVHCTSAVQIASTFSK
jgi:hypothetical protein